MENNDRIGGAYSLYDTGKCIYDDHDAVVRTLYLPDDVQLNLCETHWRQDMYQFVQWNEMVDDEHTLPIIDWRLRQCRRCLKQVNGEWFGFNQEYPMCKKCSLEVLFQDMSETGKREMFLDVELVRPPKNQSYDRAWAIGVATLTDGWDVYKREVYVKKSTNNFGADRFDFWFGIPGDTFTWHGIAYMNLPWNNSGMARCARTKDHIRPTYTCRSCRQTITSYDAEYNGRCWNCGDDIRLLIRGYYKNPDQFETMIPM